MADNILKRLQAYVDFLAETGHKTVEVYFDDLNNAVGEIERLNEWSKQAAGVMIKIATSDGDAYCKRMAREFLEQAAVGKFR